MQATFALHRLLWWGTAVGQRAGQEANSGSNSSCLCPVVHSVWQNQLFDCTKMGQISHVSRRHKQMKTERMRKLTHCGRGHLNCLNCLNTRSRGFNNFNPLNAELNPICYLLALLGAHHFLHVGRIRVKLLNLRLLMSYIYIYIYIYMERLFLMFLDHTQRRSTVGRTPLDE